MHPLVFPASSLNSGVVVFGRLVSALLKVVVFVCSFLLSGDSGERNVGVDVGVSLVVAAGLPLPGSVGWTPGVVTLFTCYTCRTFASDFVGLGFHLRLLR